MTYELPVLPYDYDTLEPHIDQRIMELHHDGHHQSYVNSANDALDRFQSMREDGDYEDIKAVKRQLAFNLSGHINHSIFWENMDPDGGSEPGGTLAEQIDDSFGSFETFKTSLQRQPRPSKPSGGRCSSTNRSPTIS